MARIRLGARPKTLAHTVTAPLPDGTDGKVAITYTYRTRKEFAALLDEVFGSGSAGAESGAEQGAAADVAAGQATIAEAMQRGLEANADYISRIAEGWDLGVPFDRPHIEQLCDELPGVALAIMADYKRLINEGRAGN